MVNLKKYPKTCHLPWSESVNVDDVKSLTTDHFHGKMIVITEKMDGENTTLYRDYYHARSLDSPNHPSRNYVKAWHHSMSYHIPEGWRICGENLYAAHSIHYNGLKSYFYGFSIWNETNHCLSWDDTVEWFELLSIPHPTILYQGIWDESYIRSLLIDTNRMEGYVVRNSESFHYNDFAKNVAKWVRKNHVQTNEDWRNQMMVVNQLMKKDTV